MSRLTRALLVVLFIVSLLPIQAAGAASLSAKRRPPSPTPTAIPTSTPTVTPSPTPSPTPTPAALSLTPPWTVPSTLGNCGKGYDSNGSETLVCWPSGVAISGYPWTATLVIYAHGYVNPYFPAKQIPWDQMSIDGTPISSQVTGMGYFFATTSYRANGLVVQDAIQDLRLVRQIAINTIHKRGIYPLLGIQVILAGVSEGGLITTLSIERYASEYKGGLVMCGPIGDFQKQANYWGDFRAIYDEYYPQLEAVYGGSAIDTPANLITDWYGTKSASTVRNSYGDAVISEANLGRSLDLLQVADAPYDATTPAALASSVRETVLGLLDYNIFSTMNGQAVVGGNPYGNVDKVYPATTYVPTLSSIISRYSASPTALQNLRAYETTGVLSRPLVVLHTTGDPIVPYWHATDYAAKVGSYSKFQVNTVERYGHCAFTMDEVVGAFGDLGGFIASGSLLAAKTQLSPEQYDLYVAQLQREGKLR